MESWDDSGFVLSVRPHGDGGAVVSILTKNHGRHAGFVHGAGSSKLRGVLQPGVGVMASWKARVSDQLGTLTIEQEAALPWDVLDDPLKLSALLSACALCDAALPEREGHEGLYHGFKTLIEMMEGEVWDAAYVYWEIAFLKELGFGLDFTRCAGGGDAARLAYISPKSGCAVSYEAGEAYKDKLLPLPAFLKPNGGPADSEEIIKGLTMTAYFLEHWAFTHHSKGMPDARVRFEEQYRRKFPCMA
jgi:DNA repair protein RecO (recombination protein O)